MMEKKDVEQKKEEKQVRKNENPAPLFVSVKTASGNVVTMRRIPDEEIKALRNPAYQYLA